MILKIPQQHHNFQPDVPYQDVVSQEKLSINHWVAIHIADNGLGMSKDVKAKLFDPFFTTKPVGKGTGLGLSISQQIIVEKHGGSVYCQSIPGKGTEFVIKIPIAQLAAQAA